MKRLLVAFLCGGAFVTSCTGYVEVPPDWRATGSPSTGGEASGGASAIGTGGAGSLSCDVLDLLQTRCATCHSSPPPPGVPIALAEAADLASPIPGRSGERAVDISIARMRSATAPMPPAPASAATVAEITLLETWLEAGMPAECEAGFGGSGGESGNPYDTPVVCTSQTTWEGGNEESPKMRPGGACISCHRQGDGDDEGEGPLFTFAGTVYPTAHEPNDCNGIDGPGLDAQVVIIDGNDVIFTMNVNSAGNFYLEQRDEVVLPYRAKVVAGGRERLMATEQSSGDCNACHTESGTENAPGRILAP